MELQDNNFDKAANPKTKTFVLQTGHNPHSNHTLGRHAKSIIENTKNIFKKIFKYPNVDFVPGGGTIANKCAIFGSIPFYPKKINKEISRNKILISSVEHKSISDVIIKDLVLRSYDIILLPIDENSIINMKKFIEILEQYSQQIALVSIMNVNNETGIIQDTDELAKITKLKCPHAFFS